jgi:small subunit ribosomal protein S19
LKGENNMSRSAKKGPFIDEKLLKKVNKQKQNGEHTAIKTWSRACQVPPDFVGHKFAIHNGRIFIEVLISEDMVGHRLGEFSPTRTFRGHGKVTKRTLDKT